MNAINIIIVVVIIVVAIVVVIVVVIIIVIVITVSVIFFQIRPTGSTKQIESDIPTNVINRKRSEGFTYTQAPVL